MKAITTKGMSITKLGMNYTEIVVRAEKTGNFTTVSLADEDRNIMLQVPYEAIKECLRGL